MSDTQLFGRTVVKGTTKALIFYIFIDIAISAGSGLGQTLHELNQKDWEQKWVVNKAGWVLIQASGILGSAFLMWKTGTSRSTKEQ